MYSFILNRVSCICSCHLRLALWLYELERAQRARAPEYSTKSSLDRTALRDSFSPTTSTQHSMALALATIRNDLRVITLGSLSYYSTIISY
ncbi:hypothetical protein B0H10DRAFT_2091334 [Mycena sp. CBHHK59/15]|nr:hypothetical protein B0H10DRAFT_2091334 [Mycena sp. CBHHK59/15]